jgi:Flp pilus assembly protein TadD
MQTDYKGAIADETVAIKLNPKLNVAYHDRAWARDALRDFPGAMADYNQAIRVYPQDTYAIGNRRTLVAWLSQNYAVYAASNVAGGAPITLAMMESAQIPTGGEYDQRKSECDSQFGSEDDYFTDCMSYGREVAMSEEDHDKRQAEYEADQAQTQAEEDQAQAYEEQQQAQSQAYDDQQQATEDQQYGDAPAESSDGGGGYSGGGDTGGESSGGESDGGDGG